MLKIEKTFHTKCFIKTLDSCWRDPRMPKAFSMQFLHCSSDPLMGQVLFWYICITPGSIARKTCKVMISTKQNQNFHLIETSIPRNTKAVSTVSGWMGDQPIMISAHSWNLRCEFCLEVQWTILTISISVWMTTLTSQLVSGNQCVKTYSNIYKD